MKREYKLIIIAIIIAATILYILFAFFQMEYNVAKWDMGMRGLYMVALLFSSVGLFAFLDEHEK